MEKHMIRALCTLAYRLCYCFCSVKERYLLPANGRFAAAMQRVHESNFMNEEFAVAVEEKYKASDICVLHKYFFRISKALSAFAFCFTGPAS